MLASLHAKQRAFVKDRARFKCALAGRRGGKSYAIAYWLIQGWRFRPGQVSLYIARTRGQARDILWKLLKELNHKWGWGAQPNETRLEMVWPNGYEVRLRGAQNMSQIELCRGPKYWRVAIDEAHLIPNNLLQFLWRSIIRPALADLMGQLCLTGTPGYDLSGMWWEKSADAEKFAEKVAKFKRPPWPTHRWTIEDNPFIPDAEAELRDVLEENGWEPDDPEYLREWKGLWVEDKGALVYPYSAPDNVFFPGHYPPGHFDPKGGVRAVISVDVGWEDGCGFVVSLKRMDSPLIVIPVAYSQCHLTDPEIATHIKKLMREFRTSNVRVDSKGNKITAMTMRNYGIPAEPATAGDKLPRIQYTRGLLAKGHLKVAVERCQDLVGEMSVLPWKLDKDSGKKVDHREGWVDECCDALIEACLQQSQTFVPPKDEQSLSSKRAAERKAAAAKNKKGRRSRVVPMR